MSESATISAVTPNDFEAQLRTLDRIATLVRKRPDRETWRFEFVQKPYYLHFFPRIDGKSSNYAANEFAGLKTLQDFKINGVRVNALLSGFQFADRKGDAVIVQGIEPMESIADAHSHHAAVKQIISILSKMAAHDVGHAALSINSFLFSNGHAFVRDGVEIKTKGLTVEHLLEFARSTEGFATRTDRIRVWRALMNDKPLPSYGEMIPAYARKLKSESTPTIEINSWRLTYLPRASETSEHSQASRLTIDAADWQREWPRLLQRINSDQLDILKRDASGDVLSAEITLQNHPINAIIKRPKNKFWYRHLLGAFRKSRAMRLFEKTRWLQVRRIAVEHPLAVMEKRRFGYVTDSFAIFERVGGVTLDQADLDGMDAVDREDFFRAAGRILRRIEATGLTHTDAKSTNWIVYDNRTPVLIDLYGIRKLNAFLQLFGIRRLLKAMRFHPQYTPTDSLHLCLGFEPRGMPQTEESEVES